MEAARLTGKPAVAPYSGEEWDLVSCELVRKAVVVPVIRKEAKGGHSSDAGERSGFRQTESTAKAAGLYEELRRTEKSLSVLVENSRGRSNKDLKAMKKAIDAIINKYR